MRTRLGGAEWVHWLSLEEVGQGWKAVMEECPGEGGYRAKQSEAWETMLGLCGAQDRCYMCICVNVYMRFRGRAVKQTMTGSHVAEVRWTAHLARGEGRWTHLGRYGAVISSLGVKATQV